jgi:2-oxoisovalerate dehydrogenase E1 component
VRIYRDMVVIREFETMLDRIKKEGVYQGIEYQHKGPAHLSIGQEASVVGQAYNLTPEDFIFGSHRSHGEILAKSLSAIASSMTLRSSRSWTTYNDGDTLKVVETFPRAGPGSTDGVKGLAIDYLLFGTLAEIFGRYAGFNRGMGGSMHAFFPPFGVMPNNAIVGGSADIATGAALFKRVNRRPASSSPTSATPPGLRPGLGGDDVRRHGPVSHPVAEGSGRRAADAVQLHEQLLRHGRPALRRDDGLRGAGARRAGRQPEAMHAERVDGYNPLAVAEAIARKKQILLEGDAARCCSTPSPTASPATRPPTRRPIAPRRRSISGASTTR